MSDNDLRARVEAEAQEDATCLRCGKARADHHDRQRFCYPFTRDTSADDALATYHPPQLAAVESVPGFRTDGLLAVGQALIDLRARVSQLESTVAETEQGKDDAVKWIGVVCTELVMAGFPPGDRTVALASIRELLKSRLSAEQEAERLREAERRLRHAGGLLANVAYNLAQRSTLTENQRRALDESCQAWDVEAAATRPPSGSVVP